MDVATNVVETEPPSRACAIADSGRLVAQTFRLRKMILVINTFHITVCGRITMINSSFPDFFLNSKPSTHLATGVILLIYIDCNFAD